jgi:HEPN domain-containing protein
MNRDDLREFVTIRLKEARVLLRTKNYSGAYYLCGYIVECGLKACIAKKTRRYDFPDFETVKQSYTHDLTRLVKTAGLEPDLDRKIKNSSSFAVNWTIVKDWTEASRYEKHTKKEAQDLHSSIANGKQGVLQWIKLHW